MHNTTPLLWSQIVHPPQAMAHSIYIIIRTNQEQTFTIRTKQEQPIPATICFCLKSITYTNLTKKVKKSVAIYVGVCPK